MKLYTFVQDRKKEWMKNFLRSRISVQKNLKSSPGISYEKKNTYIPTKTFPAKL